MRTLTLANDFHGSTARVRSGYKSRSTARRIWRQLCGSPDCMCGGILGERGSQLQPDGLRDAIIEPQSDGSVQVLWVNHDGNR